MDTRSPIEALLARLTADPGRPRLTWYGPQEERIELSGQVLDNWVTKTTNLLVEEFDSGPGSGVVLDLPTHWRTVVWALAVWRTGGCVVLGEDPGDAQELVVTARPDAWRAPDLVAVALPALARSFGTGLPAGAVDAAAAVMTYGDTLTWTPATDAGATALRSGGQEVGFADLAGWARERVSRATRPTPWWEQALAGRPARALLENEDDDVEALLAGVLVALGADGSVVLCAPPVAAALAVDPERRERLLETEQVTTQQGR